MILDITSYASLIFDCDGVVLDSNSIKTEAFRLASAPWGGVASEALVAYHVANGGVSRYAKFHYFLDEIVPLHGGKRDGPGLEELLASYSAYVRAGLLSCPAASKLDKLRDKTCHTSWLIVSGGDQMELRDVFTARGMKHLFDRGIFGSPDTKEKILSREIENGNIQLPALFLGDSRYDYFAATSAGLDFVFVHGWTEVAERQEFVTEIGVPTVTELASLLLPHKED